MMLEKDHIYASAQKKKFLMTSTIFTHLDSIAASLFVLNWLSWQIVSVSDDKIQITILILRRGALSTLLPSPMMWNWLILRVFTKYQYIKNSAFQTESIQANMHSTFRKGCPLALQSAACLSGDKEKESQLKRLKKCPPLVELGNLSPSKKSCKIEICPRGIAFLLTKPTNVRTPLLCVHVRVCHSDFCCMHMLDLFKPRKSDIFFGKYAHNADYIQIIGKSDFQKIRISISSPHTKATTFGTGQHDLKHRKNCKCCPGHYLIVLITPQCHNSSFAICEL